jgi:kynurenine formamidase
MTASLEGEAWLMHNNYAQAEGVTNLWDVPEIGALVSIGFAKTEGGTGGYARYVAGEDTSNLPWLVISFFAF